MSLIMDLTVEDMLHLYKFDVDISVKDEIIISLYLDVTGRLNIIPIKYFSLTKEEYRHIKKLINRIFLFSSDIMPLNVAYLLKNLKQALSSKVE